MTTQTTAVGSSRHVMRRMSEFRIDRVALGILALLALIAVADPPQIPTSLLFVAGSVTWIAPFILLSIGIAAYARASGAEHLIARAFEGSPRRMIVAAALIGALSPFCSCGVIPLVAGLLGAGVPLAPVVAFWISSPLMDPEMFVLMAVTLGLPFTIGKTLAAIGLGLIGGFATLAIQNHGGLANPLREDGPAACGTSEKDTRVVWKFWREPARWADFRAASNESGWFLGKWLTLAFLIESLMVAYIPAAMISDWIGSGAWWTIPAAVFVGIPAYLNGYAAIPLMASLIDMGMMPGAAMAFMIAGGVTSIPTAIAVYALVRKRVFFWYLLIALTGSALSGLLYQIAASA